MPGDEYEYVPGDEYVNVPGDECKYVPGDEAIHTLFHPVHSQSPPIEQ